MEQVGQGGIGERSLFVLSLASLDDTPELVAVPGPHFVCLLALDADEISDAELEAMAGRLLRTGCAYAVCWGSDCWRVHYAFDNADLAWRPVGPWAKTTWRSHDPLSEAIFFALFETRLDPAFEHSCGSVVGVAVGSPAWAEELRTAFASPGEFSKRFLDSE